MFSTKNRYHFILPEYEEQLFSYISNLGKRNQYPVIAAGGMSDHLHILVSVPPFKSPSNIVEEIKESSSTWMNDTYFQRRQNFGWQDGFGAFSVSFDKLNSMKSYIHNQKEHHREMTFQEEYGWFVNHFKAEYEKSNFFG